nr:MAG TPA: hypothetical protein [Microviridae sp.]
MIIMYNIIKIRSRCMNNHKQKLANRHSVILLDETSQTHQVSYTHLRAHETEADLIFLKQPAGNQDRH